MIRQKTEAVIQRAKADQKVTYLLNSKAEHRQPALHRVQMVMENDDPPERGRGGRGRGGRGRRRGRGL